MIFSTEPRSEVVRESQRGAMRTFTNRKMIKPIMWMRPGTLNVAVQTTEFSALVNKEVEIISVCQSRRNATKYSGQTKRLMDYGGSVL